MKARTLTVFALLLAALLFAALNWSAFNTPASLNIVFGRVDAPVGLMMLLALGALSLVYRAFLAQADAQALLENRRFTKRLEKARKLAEDREASRTQDLRTLLETELAQIQDQLDGLLAAHGITGVEDTSAMPPARPSEGDPEDET